MKFSLAVLTLFVATACGPDTVFAPPAQAIWADLGKVCTENSPAFSLPEARRDSLGVAGSRNIDDEWADLARAVPGGWGGAFIAGGRFTIWLVDTSQVNLAVQALRPSVTPPPPYSWDDLQVWKGRWDFAQLRDWNQYLVPRLNGAATGVHGSDVNEGQNRLLFMVATNEQRLRLEGRLSTMELPCNLVAIQVTPIPVSTVQ